MGEAVRQLHFVANQAYAIANASASIHTNNSDYVPMSDAGPNVLLSLARMIGACDVVAMARLSDYTGWMPVYVGRQCLEVGINTDVLLASPMLTEFDSISDAYWMHPPLAEGNRSTLILTFRGCRGERFVVGLLFNVCATDETRSVESAVDNALPVFLSVMENWVQFRRYQLQLDGSGAALDRLDIGIVLLNSNCEIVHENMIARRLLDSSLGIRRCGKSVASTDLTASIRFRVAIEHVLSANLSDGKKECVPLLALKRDKGQRPLLVSVCPVPSKREFKEAASAIIFVFDPEREIKHLLQSACQLFGLSPVETILACRLAQGDSVAEAASALKIQELTARGYLKQIFIKTGVNRQAALVRLLLSSIIHLGDDPELVVM
jgi:DNA-binding CsgD family transcriptional regulator